MAQQEVRYWVRAFPCGFDDVLWIFGETLGVDDLLAKERELGACEDEVRSTRRMVLEVNERGYEFGRAYSMAVPGGEFGMTPVEVTHTIYEPEFDLARSHGWQMDMLVADPVGMEMIGRVITELVKQ